MRRVRSARHFGRAAGGFQSVCAHHHRRQQFDRPIGQDDAEQMSAAGQRGVTPAGRLRDKVLAAAAYQRRGFRGIAQRGEREEERAIRGAAPPAGEEQRDRIGGACHAQHADRDQCEEQYLGVAPLVGKLEQQEQQHCDAGRVAQRRHAQQLVCQRRDPDKRVAPGAGRSAEGADCGERHGWPPASNGCAFCLGCITLDRDGARGGALDSGGAAA